MTETAELIRATRCGSGLTLEGLGKKLGYLSGQFVYNWEKGTASPPPPKLRSICSALNLDKKLMKRALINDYKKYLTKYL